MEAIIYEIRCNETGEVYFGSTFRTLDERMCGHKSPSNNCASKQIIERGNYTPKVLLECKVANKTELRKLESMFIRNNECVNKLDSYQSPEENKQYVKKYYQNYYKNCQIIYCDCGGKYKECTSDRNKHFKTKMHQRFASN